MEKNKENFIWIILAFCVVLVGIGCFYLGTYFGSKRVVSKPEDKTNVEDKADDTKMSEADIETLGEELFKKTNVNTRGKWFYFYEPMDNNSMLNATFSNISKDEFILGKYALGNYPDECTGEIGYTCFAEKIAVSKVKEKFHELFGKEKDLTLENFNYDSKFENCNIENDEYVCYVYYGGDLDAHKKYFMLDSTNLKDEETFVITTKMLVLDVQNNVYSDYELANKITTDTTLKDITDEEVKKALFEKYEKQASKYELTFNKDTNGNWYWVKTELAK